MTKNKYFVFSFCFIATLLSYLIVLHADFIGDDVSRILLNKEIISIKTALTGDLGDRPILMLVISLIYKAFGNLDTIYYRVVGIFFHILAAMQLYFLLLEINVNSESENKHRVAFFVTLLFCLHPLHNQVITTSIQMAVSMSAFLGIYSFRIFRKNIDDLKWSKFLGSWVLLLLAFLTKPIISFLPFLYLGYWKRINLKWHKKIVLYSFYFLLLFIPIVYYKFFGKNIQNTKVKAFEYFLIQTEVWVSYFKLIILPINLKFLYDRERILNFLDLSKWIYLIGHVIFLYLCHKVTKNRILFYILLCVYISFLPESGFFSIYHLAFEHRTYMPLIFIFIWLGTFLIQNKNVEKLEKIPLILMSGLSVVYLLINQNRNFEVKTYRSWAINTLEQSDSYHYSNYLFCYLLARNGHYDDVAKFVTMYQEKYKDMDYFILKDIVAFFKSPIRERTTWLGVFLNYANSTNITNHGRYFVNKVLIDDISNNTKQLDDLVLIGKILSYQLKIFFTFPLFKPFIEKYVYLNSFLLDSVNSENVKRIDPETYFALRASRVGYLGYQDKSLLSEIVEALKKNPTSTVFLDLKRKLEIINGSKQDQ